MKLLFVVALLGCVRDSGRTPRDRTPADTVDVTMDWYGTWSPPDTSPPEPTEMHVADAAFAVVHGELEHQYLGIRPSFGDVTGDGPADLVVHAAHRDHDETYVLAGPFAGDVSVSEAIAVLPDGAYGLGVGDLDGDAIDDIAVLSGATNLDPYEFQLYFGPLDAGAPPPRPDAVIRPTTGDSFGYVCDGDLDGVADLVFTEDSSAFAFALGPFERANAGEERVDLIIQGTTDPEAPAPEDYLLCGHDLTQDGAADMLIVDFQDEVWLLDDPSWSGTYELVDVGTPTTLVNVGDALGVPGDVTGDGTPDVYNHLGSFADLFDGPLNPLEEPYATFDWSEASGELVAVGDLDVDGQEDLVVAVSGYNLGSGAAFIVYGPVATGAYDEGRADFTLTHGYQTRESFGNYTASGGPSLWAVSATLSDHAADEAGAVYLFSGPPIP